MRFATQMTTRGTALRSGKHLGSALVARAQRKILIIGDAGAHTRSLTVALRNAGYDIDLASDQEEGVRHARETQPHLIILDLRLPILDGLAVTRQINRDEHTHQIPLLFLYGVDETVPQMGMIEDVDFLRKPWRTDELLARVERGLSQSGLLNRLRREAHIDELTGLANLRQFHARKERARVDSCGTALSVVAVDVDRLKQINDKYGHAAGSEALAAVGKVLRDEIRDTDLAVRSGGDEFVVLLPHTTSPEASAFAGRVLAHLDRLADRGLVVSVSMGVATLHPALGRSLDSLLEQADQATYRAKRSGGHRVCVFDPGLDASSVTMSQRILVVDDDKGIREVLREVLTLAGYQVVEAENGAVALRMLRETPKPDLVLLDLMMPVMSGWKVLELLEAGDKDLATVPVVVMSAVSASLKGLEQKGGVRACFVKPVDIDVLLDAVHRQLSPRESGLDHDESADIARMENEGG